MKKSILFLAIIASIFVACEPQQMEESSFVNEDVYGAWVCENGGHIISPDITRDLIYIINEENTEFIAEDSIIIYHGYWNYTKESDHGYVKYKYELVKGEKLVLTTYNVFSDKYVTKEFVWREDLIPDVESFINSKKKNQDTISGFLGKWEWVATEKLDSSNAQLTKHIVDTLENSVIEFEINTFICTYQTFEDFSKTKYSMLKMRPYVASINNKNNDTIIKNILLSNFDNKKELCFLFPRYTNGEYTGLISVFGGTTYKYSFENDYLILEDLFSDTKIIFRKVE